MATPALIERFQAVVCDLDGVVYAGPSAVPDAVETLNALASRDVRVVYATNNASRPAQQVSNHLNELGLHTSDADVLNSSMAGARYLAKELPAGARVLAIGGEGVGLALRTSGLTPVTAAQATAEPGVDAVLQGYGPQVTATDLAEAAYAIQGGARWVATNTDRTLPTDRGQAPGNGTLVAAVQTAVGREPDVVGKPTPVMYEMAVEALGGQPSDVVGVGDRLETDIEGANRAGCASVLVLTGVHGYLDAVTAPAIQRPTYVVNTLADLLKPEVTDAGSAPALLRELWEQLDAGTISADVARERMASHPDVEEEA